MSNTSGIGRTSIDNVLYSRTCVLNGDLNEIGMTGSRWTKYLSQYSLPNLKESISRCQKIPRDKGETIPLKFAPAKNTHLRGQCLLGITYRKYCLTLYSRIAFFPHAAILDLNMANRIARMIISPERIGLTWYASIIRVSGPWILPFLISQGKLEQILSTPFGAKIQHLLDKTKRPDKKYKFAPFRKVQQGWEPKSTPIEQLRLKGEEL